MSLFPRSFYSPADASFTPLFRLLEDFDNYSRDVQAPNQEGRRAARGSRVFHPRFDVRETDHTYELHGELPGIDKEHLHIEFTEPQTLVVSGRVERSYSSGTPPAGLVESGEKEKGKEVKGASEVEKSEAQPADKYWVSERSIGEFSRTFSFPSPVDQDTVTAGLDNGILNLSIPKAKKKESRRITIN